MSRSTRWTIAVLVVVAALVVALVAELRDTGNPAPQPPTVGDAAPTATPAELTALRARAALPPCPPPGDGAGPPPLRGLTVECAADGSGVDVARTFADRAVLVNLWAYWCAPCREELPAMAEYQRRVGSEVTVVTVHQDPDQVAALSLLAELGVRLPTLQDAQRRIAAALKVPNVMPATVLFRPDGSVAEILPRAFATADEIAAVVDQRLGVPR